MLRWNWQIYTLRMFNEGFYSKSIKRSIWFMYMWVMEGVEAQNPTVHLLNRASFV